MPVMPPSSQHTPVAWSGDGALMQQWLDRRRVVESLLNVVGSSLFLLLGLIALVFTSCVTAALVLFILVEGNSLLSLFGLGASLLRPALFYTLFVLFLGLSVLHAYVTRERADGPAKFQLSLSPWDFISAGPTLVVLAGQDFHRSLRLARLDVARVSALLLWIFDRGGHASFAEICLAFPGLNAVRVLPQLRDIPGIHFWTESAEVSFTEDFLETLKKVLHREPKSAAFGHTYTYTYEERRGPQYEERRGPQQEERRGPRPREPVVEVGQDIRSWYATLNLPLFANLQEVKKRYRKLAKIYHPDAQSAERAAGRVPNEEHMKRINEAYHNILRHTAA